MRRDLRRRKPKQDQNVRMIKINADGDISLTDAYPGIRFRIRQPSSLRVLIDNYEVIQADLKALRRAGYIDGNGVLTRP